MVQSPQKDSPSFQKKKKKDEEEHGPTRWASPAQKPLKINKTLQKPKKGWLHKHRVFRIATYESYKNQKKNK